MNILVIGGSYFLGKHFVNMVCRDNTVTVFNRGNALLGIDGVIEIRGDRHSVQALEQLRGQSYDVVVDFCAYQKNDITSVFQVMEGNIRQYIYISTVDVYMHGLMQKIDENGIFETREIAGPEGVYVRGKVLLEHELIENALEYNVNYTSIRPAFIYGPGNYAPREGIYFHWIKQLGQILQPEGATGEFQPVYVGDVAKAIMVACGNEAAYNRAYNLAPEQSETYDSYADALKQIVPKPFDIVTIPLSVIAEKQISFPFPLTKEESNCYDGSKALTLIGAYRSLVDGLRLTADSYEF